MNHSDQQREGPTRCAIKVNLKPSLVGWIVAASFVSILLIAGLLTSYYTVGAESEGVVLRFGKFLKTVEPGLHFKLPSGIDAVTVPPKMPEVSGQIRHWWDLLISQRPFGRPFALSLVIADPVYTPRTFFRFHLRSRVLGEETTRLRSYG